MVDLKCKYVGCDNMEKDGTTMAEAIDLMKFHISAIHGNGQGEEEDQTEKIWTGWRSLKRQLKQCGKSF